MFLVSDAGRTRFAAKEAFIVRTQGSCKAKLGGSRSEVCIGCSCSLGSQLICFLLACCFVGFYYAIFASFVSASYFAYICLISDQTR